MEKTLYQKWFRGTPVFFSFVEKLKISLLIWYKYFLRNVWRDLKLLMSASATATRKSVNVKFTAKTNFLIGYSMLPFLMLTSEVKEAF